MRVVSIAALAVRWRRGAGTLDLFGGVQNVTNRENVSGYSWDRRNDRLRLDTQLGVFPILGLEWRFGD